MTGSPAEASPAKSENVNNPEISSLDVPTRNSTRTKKEMLEDQTGSLCTMAGEMQNMSQIHHSWVEEKRKTATLGRLRQMRDDAVITEDKYRERARALL